LLIPRFYHGAIEGKQRAKAQKVTEQVPVWKNGRELAQGVQTFASWNKRKLQEASREINFCANQANFVDFSRNVDYS